MSQILDVRLSSVHERCVARETLTPACSGDWLFGIERSRDRLEAPRSFP